VDITLRGLWTMIHGMAFGALYLLACSGAILEFHRLTTAAPYSEPTLAQERFLKAYLVAMVVLSWAAVFTGAYIIYPWYRVVPPRAVPPHDAPNLAMFPQRLLQSNPATAAWHSFGMEWKEHVAWFAPISITMVAFTFIRYGRHLRRHQQIRSAVLVFAATSFVAAGIAGFLGAMINKAAPIQGGPVIHLRPSQE